ncbi:MAG: alanine racemase [Gemmatimonadota bacterium]|jgi:alanine racemase
MSTEKRARAWVDVSSSALRENLLTLRRAVGSGVGILPMVKANAYGLGVSEAVAHLEPLDPWGFGVASVGEGVELRDLGVARPILVCSPTSRASYEEAVRRGLRLSLSDLEGLSALKVTAESLGIPARFHLDVDTGMGRAGFDWRSAQDWIPALAEAMEGGLELEGAFTHFHSADSADDGSLSRQWARLEAVVALLPADRRQIVVHACNSPGALRRPDVAADLVRPGIFLYGGVAGEALPAPAPVASLRARIVLKKEVPPGSTVGYGATYSARARELWATAAIGYGDGLPRLLSNRGHAVLRGKRVPIIGRISMDVTVLDVTQVPDTEVGDVVTFFGRSPGEEISLEEVAEHAGTINYEVLTGLTRRLPRIWTDHGGY